ncbi:hypothetical protein B0H10DRAFT_2131732 [Mycena sp. CBHHK59/15]|nr:hypothetical protein B0H10DRAFT_2131732 [Mycena sp. CBHHK59/15]
MAIDDLIEGALVIADHHFQDLEDGNIADGEDNEWEDAFEVISLAPSPLSSAASSPLLYPPRSRPGSPSASVSSKLQQASPDSCKLCPGSPLSDSCPTTPMPIDLADDLADDLDLPPLIHDVHRRRRLEKAVARRRKSRQRATPHTPFERFQTYTGLRCIVNSHLRPSMLMLGIYQRQVEVHGQESAPRKSDTFSPSPSCEL